MARELEQFLGRGEEKVFWIFSIKNVGGVIVGGFFGSRIGQLMGSGGIVLVLSIVGAILGLLITLNRRGLLWGRRGWLLLLFYARRVVHPGIIDTAALYTVVEEREHTIIVRKKGQTVVAPRGAVQPTVPAAEEGGIV